MTGDGEVTVSLSDRRYSQASGRVFDTHIETDIDASLIADVTYSIVTDKSYSYGKTSMTDPTKARLTSTNRNEGDVLVLKATVRDIYGEEREDSILVTIARQV